VEYRQEHPDGYGYSQFCHRYRQWKKDLNPTMRQKHKAGEKLFVDYAGQTVAVVDPETGEIQLGETLTYLPRILECFKKNQSDSPGDLWLEQY